MKDLRLPFFIAALIIILIIVLAEIGAVGLLRGSAKQLGSFQELIAGNEDLSEAASNIDKEELESLLSADKPPGLAIPSMGLLDGILLFTVGLMGLGLLIKERLHGRLQGIITLIFSILLIISGIVTFFVTLAALILRVSLFLAVPFGTLAYLAMFGFFNKTGASVTLGLLAGFKLAFAITLLLAHQRFLQNKGLVLMIITSFVANIIISFLHGIVPMFLVSITDAIAAIIVIILAVLWAIFLLIGSVPSLIKSLKLTQA